MLKRIIKNDSPMVTPEPLNKKSVLSADNRIFTDMPVPYWKTIIDKASIKHYKRREIIYLNGDTTKYIYIILKGLVMLSQIEKNGTEVGQSLVVPGNTFGELEVLNQITREQQATALTDCQIYTLPVNLFNELLQKSAIFSHGIVKLTSQRNRKSNYRQAYITMLSVPNRLALLLIEMAYIIGYKDNNGYHFNPCFTHQDIATLIISSRETVCSIMSDFRKKDLIEFDRKHITIKNISALENHP